MLTDIALAYTAKFATMDTAKDRDMDKNDILEQHIETGPEATAVSINRNTNAR